MTTIEQRLIQIVNDVRDNLWLGAAESAKKIINKDVLNKILDESTKESRGEKKP